MPRLLGHELYRFYRAGDEETVALRGVSLQLGDGESVAVSGPSGSGKTTLLHILAGLDEPDGGQVDLAGARMSHRPEAERAELRARTLGILLQHGNLFDHLSVLDNVRLQMAMAGRRDDERARMLLARVGLDARGSALPRSLSGGEAARAGLAVALACEPSVILADEPTGEVDAQSERRVLDLLDDWRRSGGAALVVTHSAAVARWADRAIELRDGRIVNDGHHDEHHDVAPG